jgi:hypothetical protein
VIDDSRGDLSDARKRKYPFRVFVSYAHEDRDKAEKVVTILEDMGLQPVWDKDLRPGMAFAESIKGLITHVHVFMPLITENTKQRPWVHQETGYASALNIPVLPIALGSLPAEIIAQLQAISVEPDLSDLAERLQEANIEQVVFPPPLSPRSIVEVVDWPETRTELMGQYANRVIEFNAHGKVRQRGGLSSFSIPDKDVDHPIWKWRDGNSPRSRYYHNLQREERVALESHARFDGCGCDLIIDLTLDFTQLGRSDVTSCRLKPLLEFLETMNDSNARVVMSERARSGNLTIVGDWFVAESQVPRPGEGYRQTVFNWHAPTVLRAQRRFDREFDELYQASGVGPDDSRRAAIAAIKKILDGLPECGKGVEIAQPKTVDGVSS